MVAKSGFTLEDLAQMGPDEITRKRRLAEALIAQNAGLQDIKSPWQGFAQLANALVGNLKEARLDRAEREGKEGANALFGAGMGTGVFPPAPSGGGGAGNASPPPSGSGSYRDAIAGIESGGNYQAMGPETKGDRAYGKYQMMGANIGPWSEATFGHRMTPQQFMASPEAQDAIFDKIFGGYVTRFGPEAAAQAWFGGPGSIGKTHRSDVLGTDVGSYGKRFMASLGQNPGQPTGQTPAPTQVASIDPNSAMAAGLQAQGFAPDSEQAQAFARLQPGAGGAGVTTDPSGVMVAETPEAIDRLSRQQMSAGSGAPQGPGGQGEIRVGAGGQPYQYVETTGMAGASGPQGWIPTSQTGGQPQQAQLAQAMIGDPAQTLGAPAIQPSGPDLRTLMNMAGNEFMNPMQQRMIQALTGQRMDDANPEHQLDMEYKRAQLQKLQRGDVSEFQQRAAAAQQFGLDPNTPEGRDFILTGKMGGEVSKPAGIQEYEYAKQQGFPGTFQDWEASKKGGMSLQVDPATGAVTFQQGSNIKPMTEAQSKDTYFATKAAGSLPNIDKYGDALASFGENAAANTPLVGNYMKSDEYQQAEQAGGEFLAAILRKESGAAVPESEREQYGKVYLPRPGDGAPVLAQKKEARQRALDALKAGMTPQAILAQEQALSKGADALPEGVTEDDIQHTMKLHGVTREQVLERLRAP